MPLCDPQFPLKLRVFRTLATGLSLADASWATVGPGDAEPAGDALDTGVLTGGVPPNSPGVSVSTFDPGGGAGAGADSEHVGGTAEIYSRGSRT